MDLGSTVRVVDIHALRRIHVGNDRDLAGLKAEFDREVARLRRERSRDNGALPSELAEVDRGIERCLDFIVSGDAAPATVRDKLIALERRRTSRSSGGSRSAAGAPR